MIADVSGVGLGLAFWRYARAIVDTPKWRLSAHTYVVNAPLWARGAWRVLSGWLSGATPSPTHTEETLCSAINKATGEFWAGYTKS